MGWTKLSDHFYDDPKIARVGNDGTGLYAKALAYCSRHDTRGKVPKAWLHIQAGPAEELPERLRKAGLIRDVPGEDYEIPNYLKYNPTPEQREEKRRQERERKRRQRASRQDDAPVPPNVPAGQPPGQSISHGGTPGTGTNTGSGSGSRSKKNPNLEANRDLGQTPNLDSHPAVFEATGRIAEVRGCEFPRADRVEAVLRDFAHLDGPERIASGCEDYWCNGEGRHRKLRDPVKALRMAFEYADQRTGSVVALRPSADAEHEAKRQVIRDWVAKGASA